ncbi:TlpA family protein disulfide reductase [Shewanella dokdonensis]|uniref:TlpA family protein disulfide reductase n=1 Tax=Shewanella dokdonensis TaxID=712036 RepID=A0ABX8DB80_9GAMM|nr:TlpA disulfide reductase family protein [Shewanella dokdonensis]MCL1075398.1 TlpA family protein disulfide reductase [Shewanella dokdonensis]QVK22094.1 TlpA family protein disulfide reductase [Shewanella dokdonensis]
MKRYLSWLLLLLWLLSVDYAQANAHTLPKPMVLRQLVTLQHPQPLAPITLRDLQGTPHTFTENNGRMTVLSLWATWCTLCVRDLQHLQQLIPQLDPQQLSVVPLSIDEDLTLVPPFLQQHQLQFPQLWLDPQQQVADILPTDVVPATFLLNGNGELVGFVRGYVDWADASVAPYLQQLAQQITEEQP